MFWNFVSVTVDSFGISINRKHEMFWNTKDTADFLGISKINRKHEMFWNRWNSLAKR